MLWRVMALAPDVVQRQEPVDDPTLPIVFAIAIVMTVLPIIWITRHNLRKRRGLPAESPRRSSFGTAIGNAFFDIGSALDPNRPDVETICRIEEEGVEDEAGDGRNPERARASRRPLLGHPRKTALESGSDDARGFKPEGDAADADEQVGDDHHRAADRSPDALPPSVPRQ